MYFKFSPWYRNKSAIGLIRTSFFLVSLKLKSFFLLRTNFATSNLNPIASDFLWNVIYFFNFFLLNFSFLPVEFPCLTCDDPAHASCALWWLSLVLRAACSIFGTTIHPCLLHNWNWAQRREGLLLLIFALSVFIMLLRA